MSDPNALILRVISTMPKGGGYSVKTEAALALRNSHSVQNGTLRLQPALAQPSYCSGATYLVLLKTLAELQRSARLSLSGELWEALRVKPLRDGHGVWGRWNANGPGTAVLFHELGAGRSFTDANLARPGDFLKIWWNDSVGKTERGHLVVFLRLETHEGVPGLLFWSSNQPDGYGEKWVPMEKCRRLLFSRLEHPEKFSGVGTLPKIDPYLSTLLERASSFQEALQKSGVR